MFDLLTDLLDFGHNTRGTLPDEASRFFWLHICLGRSDSCPRVGEVGQIFASRFLFDLWLVILADDSDITVIDKMAFISLTAAVKHNLDSHFFYLNSGCSPHTLGLHMTYYPAFNFRYE